MADGFDELALPLLPALYNYARWLTKDASEAEDLVQETYVKAMRGFASFARGTNFRAWIYRILRNTFLTSRSGLRQQTSIEDEEFDVAGDSPEAHLIMRIDHVAVRRAIDELPVIFREVLLLCDVEDMSYREIAEALSVPVGTVTSRLMRARRKVREALQT
ncbi:MAG TPA: sigma-70 family RNA polymerase sigma factor [Thermoanaerobaculia bacterium]|nr:sigma-70 family RNA polymerase sigma factor [Thermoanaerobaculia bacterium]